MSTERIAKAQQAARELKMTEQAFEMLGKYMLNDLMATAPEETDKREKLFFGMRGLVMAKKALIMAAADADMANYNAILAEAGFAGPRP